MILDKKYFEYNVLVRRNQLFLLIATVQSVEEEDVDSSSRREGLYTIARLLRSSSLEEGTPSSSPFPVPMVVVPPWHPHINSLTTF